MVILGNGVMKITKSLLAGIILFAFGLAFFIFSQSYQMGSVALMGPGYFPRFISASLMVIGLITIFTKNDR